MMIDAGINPAHRALIAKYMDQIQNAHVTIELKKYVHSHIVRCFFLTFIHHVSVSLNLLNSYGSEAKIVML
jgi:hypothetical protein